VEGQLPLLLVLEVLVDASREGKHPLRKKSKNVQYNNFLMVLEKNTKEILKRL